MKKLLQFVIVLAVGFMLWDLLGHRKKNPGELVRTAPAQSVTLPLPFTFKGFQITPLVAYEIDGRIIARQTYSGEIGADLSPLDLGICWGEMCNDRVLNKINASISERFLYLRYSGKRPTEVIGADSELRFSNNHIIPATPEIEAYLTSLRPGQYVSLKGYLVHVSDSSGYHWMSSVSRKDRGEGACEVIYVRSAAPFQHDTMASVPEVSRSFRLRSLIAATPTPTPSPAPIGEYTLQADLPIRFANGRVSSVSAQSNITILRRLGENTQARYSGMTFWVKTTHIR